MNTLPRQTDQAAVVDQRIEKTVPLITPPLLHDELPLERRAGPEPWSTAAEAVTDVLTGEDDRLLVVVGPCSVHDAEAAAGVRRTPATGRRAALRRICWS